MRAAMDLRSHTHTHADNDIFKKQLNSMAIIIGLNKTAYYGLKCTQIKQTSHLSISTVIDYPISVSLHDGSYDDNFHV